MERSCQKKCDTKRKASECHFLEYKLQFGENYMLWVNSFDLKFDHHKRNVCMYVYLPLPKVQINDLVKESDSNKIVSKESK